MQRWGKVIARISMHNDISMDSLEGRRIEIDLPEIKKLCDRVETMILKM